MPSEDVYKVSGQDFVEIYPLTNRDITTGLWMMISINSAFGSEPDNPTWPPEDEPTWDDVATQSEGGHFKSKEMFLWYADNVDGTDQVDLEEFTDETGYEEYAFYGDQWFGIELYSEFDYNINPGNSFHSKDYTYSPGWVHYDLRGIDFNNIVQAEFVLNLFISGDDIEASNADDLPFIVQIRNDITEYNGWQPSPYDFQTITGGSICPAMTAREISERSESAEEHEYSDPYKDADEWGTYSGRHVLPINDFGLKQLRKGGRQGIYFGLLGDDPPLGFNRLFVECDYEFWDTNIEEFGPQYAGFLMPHLRLWMEPQGAEIEANVKLPIVVQAQLESPIERVTVNHSAKRLVRR